jgi:hypothetical protein
MNTRQKEFLCLLVIMIMGVVIAVGLQPWLLQQLPFSMTNKELDEWMDSVFSPVNYGILILGILTSLFWYIRAYKVQFMKAKPAINNRIFWWILLCLYWLIGAIAYLLMAYSNEWLGEGEGAVASLICLCVDVVFLYWLPTAMATPKSLRYVPPFSVELRKLYGG